MTRACIAWLCTCRRSDQPASLGDERGVSAVEFAMLLPLMLTLYLGAVEISQGIGADRKVTLTARTVADLVSQVDEHQQRRHDQLAQRGDGGDGALIRRPSSR